MNELQKTTTSEPAVQEIPLNNYLQITEEVIRKNYLTRLSDLPVVPVDPIPLEEDLIDNVRLFKISEMVYQKGEPITEKFTTVFNTLSTYNASVFNGCTALVELQLPTGFNMSNSSYTGDTYFIQGDTNINIYVYEIFTVNSNASDGWRRISNEVVPVHYLVQNVQQLLDANVINSDPSVVNGSTQFWTLDANGHAINLGNVVSYDGSTVTFSNGSTLTGNVFVH